MNNNLPLITKYRPDDFEQVLGNEVAIKKLAETVRNPVSRPHAYILTGSSGIGKTTLAHIIAKEINAITLKMNAASNSSIDDTRLLVETAKFKPIMDKPNVVHVIDEAHNYSQKAWEPLLDLTEHAPPFLYFVFCTTEPTKVPVAIKNRCYTVALRSLKTPEIEALLSVISELEGWTVNNDVFNAICLAAGGSARKALSILQVGHGVANCEELAQVIEEVESENSPITKLCQYLVKGGKNWKTISPLLTSIDEPEPALTHAVSYLTTVMIRSDEEQARNVWRMIESLSESRASWDKKIQLYAGVGKILWGTIPF